MRWAAELSVWVIPLKNFINLIFILDFIFCQCQTSTIGNLSMLSFNREEGDGFIPWLNLFFRGGCFGPDCEDVGLPAVAQSHLNICIGIDPSDDKIVFPVPKMLPYSITVPLFLSSLYLPDMTHWQNMETSPSATLTIRHQLNKKKTACFLRMWHHLKGK